MLLLGTKNIGTQTVLPDGVVNIGSVYRKFCKKNYTKTRRKRKLKAYLCEISA